MLEMLSLPKIDPGLLECVMSAVSSRANMGHPIPKMQLSPKFFVDWRSFWRTSGAEVEEVVNPLKCLQPFPLRAVLRSG